jgi:AraC-like DNA-binding protein
MTMTNLPLDRQSPSVAHSLPFVQTVWIINQNSWHIRTMQPTQRTIIEIPCFSDPLGETLHLLKLTGILYSRAELTAPWGAEMPPFEGCMMFHIVTAGHCWLVIKGEEPRLLQQGSLALVPHGYGHRILSAPDVEALLLFDIPVEQVSDRYEIMRFGGGGERTQLTCGVVRFDHLVGQQLVALLPRVLQIDSWAEAEDSWLQSTLRFIAHEAKALRAGGETVMTHLADILIIQAIRSWIDSAPVEERGWLAALRDPQIGKALMALHREPGKDWTLASLAKVVGMSRSGFSARFTDLVGEAAMRYLTRRRMQLARAQLKETTAPLAALAKRCGYQSEAAFSRAFKREFGVPPGRVRKATATDGEK